MIVAISLIIATTPLVSVSSIDAIRLRGTEIKIPAVSARSSLDVICGPAIRIEWMGELGTGYIIERSVDLRTWEPLPVLHEGEGKQIVWHTTPCEPHRYYRLLSVQERGR